VFAGKKGILVGVPGAFTPGTAVILIEATVMRVVLTPAGLAARYQKVC
jgi:hypothetical protein